MRLFDAGIVAVPLLLGSRPALRWFGLRMMGSVVASAALLASWLPLCVVRLLPRPIIPDAGEICRQVVIRFPATSDLVPHVFLRHHRVHTWSDDRLVELLQGLG